jgi:8-amino-7-oxononanoate synthase
MPTSPPGGWLARWLSTNQELVRLHDTGHPMIDAVVEAVDGRRIKVGDHWLVDFASCNYLGLDLDEEVVDGVGDYLRAWGTHPSWSRMLGSPALYERLEARLAELLGADDVLALPSLTLLHPAVVPVLAQDGAVFIDARAHKTVWDACVLARNRGATLERFAHHDLDDLSRRLRATTATPRIVCTDGVNSMTGNPPDLAALSALARAHDALVYVDDAHGFGVIGERAAGEPCPYGVRGNGVVRHTGSDYDAVVLSAGMSKAYSSLLAFVTCTAETKRLLKLTAPPYLYSGPSPVASLATALLGLDVNERRGDTLRARLWHHTGRILAHLGDLGVATPNRSGFPIIEVPLADPDSLDAVGRHLFDRGIYATLAFYPGVPRAEVGVRLQVTAANTDDDVTALLAVLEEVADRFGLRTVADR